MLPRLVTLRKMQEPASGSEKMFKIEHGGFWATSGQASTEKGRPASEPPLRRFQFGLGRDPFCRRQFFLLARYFTSYI